jgi:hypothetical protein
VQGADRHRRGAAVVPADVEPRQPIDDAVERRGLSVRDDTEGPDGAHPHAALPVVERGEEHVHRVGREGPEPGLRRGAPEQGRRRRAHLAVGVAETAEQLRHEQELPGAAEQEARERLPPGGGVHRAERPRHRRGRRPDRVALGARIDERPERALQPDDVLLEHGVPIFKDTRRPRM